MTADHDAPGAAGPPTVLTEDRGEVRVLSLNRPHRRNAIDLQLRIDLAQAVEEADRDAHVRAVVLTGNGRTFCAGGDISTMHGVDERAARDRTDAAQRVTRALTCAATPVVAAVEGTAFGAGMALALACDRVIAARDARFGTAFTRVGLAGDMGITFTLPARVGIARARQLLMLPTELTGTDALDLGLVDGLAEPGEALTAALADAQRLADGPPLALATVKRAMAAPAADIETALQREADAQVRLFASEDLAEGAIAFAERRAPRFTGH
ncbi:enoyl-CoA hydratase/isomerase family protein [Nitriliruptor alkaliphilus]|uniref:enoyl-CoA hydratase/isomerase family protein n=1 Tax=Nitriliruptor alkaliphilus TaxID=427918 RepID=UPI0006964CF6|nr:enoyl-CoA hydratase-related protein [Nitriliruptor alkaliphilus]